MSEIVGSPLSRHDLDVIHGALVYARRESLPVREIHMSDERLRVDGLRVAGVPIRRVTALGLNEGLLVFAIGRRPYAFDFESQG